MRERTGDRGTGNRRSGDRRYRLVLADDHDLARAGLRDLLSDEPSLDIVGEASDGQQAVSLCQSLKPDLVLMDVRMPVMDGLAATRRIKEAHPEIGVLMITMQEDPNYLLEALRAGAAGYILKDAPRAEVVSAVLKTLSGDAPLSPKLAAKLLRRIIAEERQNPPRTKQPVPRTIRPPSEPLTPRELEVLRLLSQGHTNRRIAIALVISVGTVKNHVERIISKLGVSDRTQAAVRAYELNLVEPPDDA